MELKRGLEGKLEQWETDPGHQGIEIVSQSETKDLEVTGKRKKKAAAHTWALVSCGLEHLGVLHLISHYSPSVLKSNCICTLKTIMTKIN